MTMQEKRLWKGLCVLQESKEMTCKERSAHSGMLVNLLIGKKKKKGALIWGDAFHGVNTPTIVNLKVLIV